MNQTNIKLAAIWTAHFLLWTYSDMLTLMQKIGSSADDKLLLFVAVPLGIMQAGLIIGSFFLKRKVLRTISFILTPIFLIFNTINLIEVSRGWEYLLTAAFIAINVLTISVLIKWKE